MIAVRKSVHVDYRRELVAVMLTVEMDWNVEEVDAMEMELVVMSEVNWSITAFQNKH